MATGKKLWTKAVNEQYQVRKGYFGAACSPLVEGGRVILNVGGRDAGVVAFDAATGEEVWRATRDGASYSSPVAATVAGRRWLFVFTRAGLAALDPADGTVRLTFPWRARIDASVNAAAPLVLDDRFVFLTSSYSTGAVLLDVTKEAAPVVWKSDDVLSCHYNTPVAAGDHLYGVDGRQEGDSAKLRCVDWKTGRVAWSRDDFGCAQIVRVGRQLLVLTENGELLLLDADPSAYKERARFQAAQGKPVRAPMALVEGRLYFRDARQLVCLDLRGR
jgi:outer membrane protein assembly factor BamB